jgi:hypothetical protein
MDGQCTIPERDGGAGPRTARRLAVERGGLVALLRVDHDGQPQVAAVTARQREALPRPSLKKRQHRSLIRAARAAGGIAVIRVASPSVGAARATLHFVKCSQKTGQRAKVYPEPLKGYENGEAPEVYRAV